MDFFSVFGFRPGTEIDFELPTRSKWTIVKKISDHLVQLDQRDVDDKVGISRAWALFLCQNDSRMENNDDPAFMRIYMQVPTKGTEYDSREERKKQAAFRYHSELDAYKEFDRQASEVRTNHELTTFKTLTNRVSKVTPTLLGYKQSKQDDRLPVPGGYITYIVWEKVPGIQLGDGTFLYV